MSNTMSIEKMFSMFNEDTTPKKKIREQKTITDTVRNNMEKIENDLHQQKYDGKTNTAAKNVVSQGSQGSYGSQNTQNTTNIPNLDSNNNQHDYDINDYSTVNNVQPSNYSQASIELPQIEYDTPQEPSQSVNNWGGAIIGSYVGASLSNAYGKDFLHKALIAIPCAVGGFFIDNYFKRKSEE